MNNFSKFKWPYLACLLATSIFAMHYIVAKSILSDGVSLFSLSSWRGLVGGGILLMVFRRELSFKLIKDNWMMLLLISSLGFFVNQILFMEGLERSSSTEVAIVSNTIPIISGLFAWIFRLEILTPPKMIGLCISFVAICFLALKNTNIGISFHLGPALIFLNVLSFGLAFALAKRLLDRDFPYESLTGIMLVTGGAMMAITSGDSFFQLPIYAKISSKSFLFVFFEIVISTSVVYLINLWTVKKIGITKVTAFVYLQPIIAALAIFIMDRTLPENSSFIAYGGILLGGCLTLRAD